MKPAAIAVVAFFLLLAALAALVPASFVDRRVATVTRGALRVADTNGTLWSGAGALTDRAGAWRIPLRWHVRFDAILRGALEVELAPASDADTPRGRIALTNGSFALSNAAIAFPAKALAALLPARDAVDFGGTVVVTAASFRWADATGSGSIAARWAGARLVSGAGGVDLGTIDIALAPQGNGLTGRVTNVGGDVRVEGALGVSPTAADLEIRATPLPAAPPEIVRALGSLGMPDGQGGTRLQWRSRTS